MHRVKERNTESKNEGNNEIQKHRRGKKNKLPLKMSKAKHVLLAHSH